MLPLWPPHALKIKPVIKVKGKVFIIFIVSSLKCVSGLNSAESFTGRYTKPCTTILEMLFWHMLSTIAYISKTFPYKTQRLQAQVFGMKCQVAFHKTGDEIIAVVVFRPHVKAHWQTRHFRRGDKFFRLQLRGIKIIRTALVN